MQETSHLQVFHEWSLYFYSGIISLRVCHIRFDAISQQVTSVLGQHHRLKLTPGLAEHQRRTLTTSESQTWDTNTTTQTNCTPTFSFLFCHYKYLLSHQLRSRPELAVFVRHTVLLNNSLTPFLRTLFDHGTRITNKPRAKADHDQHIYSYTFLS